MTFEFYPLRFEFTAIDSIHFPAGKSGNILRGAFGIIFRRIAPEPVYARMFEPGAPGLGPSGLADWPRPFVFRARHLDGMTVAPGESFHFGLNSFETRDPQIGWFHETFAAIGREGLGPRRGHAELLPGTPATPASISLDPAPQSVTRIRVDFLTPTELKSAPDGRPEFAILFARIRDRLSTLRALYGAGPLEIDFKGMGERAEAVRMTSCETRLVEVERRSSRTGQTHPLGGFVGTAEYQGPHLAEFLPFLEAARFTGVGRQTVWGKGELSISAT